MYYDSLPTPAVVVHLDAVDRNIRRMVGEAERYGIAHRPHIKSHKSLYFARRQMTLGAVGVTCAKLGEAETMVEGGVGNILLAFPLIGVDKMQRFGQLMDEANVTTIVNSVTGAGQLSSLGMSKKRKIPVLIEVDGGIRRGGLAPYAPALRFAEEIAAFQGIEIIGLMYYGGMIYGEKEKADMERATVQERDDLLGTADLLRKAGFDMRVLSGGTSFSSKLPALLEGVTEIRAGHYIFNDCGQLFSGFAVEEDCALHVAATLVSITGTNSGILDVGTKSLTSDLNWRHPGYGYVTGRPDILIEKLNEEHAFIKTEKSLDLAVGDRVAIIPNHACVVCNMVDEVYGFRNNSFECMIPIEARGKSV